MRTRISVDGSALEAGVFDMDGVVTRTASLHFAAWKRAFDELLQGPIATSGDRRAFEREDYLAYVDGRPRLEGIRTFLAARGIPLPEGDEHDPADALTIRGLGEKKEEFFLEELSRNGVTVDLAAVRLASALRHAGVRIGIATSSRNAAAILRRAGLTELFEARVDGVLAAERKLRGKPHPDIFLACLRALECEEPSRAFVIEDAAAGVAAARAGGFGLAIGVDRGGNRERLADAGAQWIVEDLRELSVEGIARYFPESSPSPLGTRTT